MWDARPTQIPWNRRFCGECTTPGVRDRPSRCTFEQHFYRAPCQYRNTTNCIIYFTFSVDNGENINELVHTAARHDSRLIRVCTQSNVVSNVCRFFFLFFFFVRVVHLYVAIHLASCNQSAAASAKWLQTQTVQHIHRARTQCQVQEFRFVPMCLVSLPPVRALRSRAAKRFLCFAFKLITYIVAVFYSRRWPCTRIAPPIFIYLKFKFDSMLCGHGRASCWEIDSCHSAPIWLLGAHSALYLYIPSSAANTVFAVFT